LKDRYLGQAASAIYLIRPDQHIAARWTECNPGQVAKALAKAAGVQSWCN
jgi:3-(3-hydroxy-phenyl)propionate hydroxylase